jgi:hypothetical protein
MTDFLGMGEIIKSQTAELERLRELLWQEAGNRVEIERLRAALQQIADMCPATHELTLAHEMAGQCYGRPEAQAMTDPYTEQAKAMAALSTENGLLRAEIERLRTTLRDCINGRRAWMEKAKNALERKP